MTKRNVLILAVAWVVSLISVGVWAQGAAPQVQLIRPGEPFGDVITAANIGFQRVAGPPDRRGTISGHLVVKVGDEWLVATSPMIMRQMAAN